MTSVSGPLALGTMMFGSWGNTDETECHKMVHRALDAGITLFDTADVYDAGTSERILGEALRGRRERVVIATKVGSPIAGDALRSGLSRHWITTACDDSLRRLGVEHIDLYQMHRPDPSTPLEETLAVFDELIRCGKVGAIGTSTFSAAQLDEVHAICTSNGWVAPITEQPPYSILARGVEHTVFPALKRHGMGALVWAPLNGGWLTGKYQSEATDANDRAHRQPDHFDHRNDAIRAEKRGIVDRLSVIAADHGMTLTTLALAFVLDDPTVVAALIGPRTLPQLEQLLTFETLTLPGGAREAIDAIVGPGHMVNPADAG